MERVRSLRTTIGFLAGMGVTTFGLFVLPPILGRASFFVAASGTKPLLTLIVPAIVGGIVAGSSVVPVRRGMVAFALAFPPGLFLPFLLVLNSRTLSGLEFQFIVLLGTPLTFGLSFGVLGGLATSCLGRGWWLTMRATIVFAGAGTVGGTILGLATVLLALSDSNATLFIVIIFSAFLVPAALAGHQLGLLLRN